MTSAFVSYFDANVNIRTIRKRRDGWVDKLTVRLPFPEKDGYSKFIPDYRFNMIRFIEMSLVHQKGIYVYFSLCNLCFLYESTEVATKSSANISTHGIQPIVSTLPITLTCLTKYTSVLKWVRKEMDSKVRIIRQLR